MSHILAKDSPKVLVIMTDHHLGDFTITLPAINALAEYFDNGITLVVSSCNCHLVNLLPARGKIRMLVFRQEKKLNGIMRFFYFVSLLFEIASGRYKTTITISHRDNCSLFALASFAKTRIGFSQTKKSWVFNDKLQTIQGERKFEFYSRVLTKIGINGMPQLPRFVIPKDKKQAAEQAINYCFANPKRPLVIVHPTAGKMKRYWPIEKFAQTLKEVIRRYDMNVCLIGTPDEIDTLGKLKQLVGDSDRCAIVMKPLDIILAILERGDLLVSNLSGPTHLATLCSNIPIVTICEVGVQSRWALIRKENTVMLNKPCPECLGRKCKTLRCIPDVSVEQVLDAIENLKGYWQSKAGKQITSEL